jgi:hypothetical protein
MWLHDLGVSGPQRLGGCLSPPVFEGKVMMKKIRGPSRGKTRCIYFFLLVLSFTLFIYFNLPEIHPFYSTSLKLNFMYLFFFTIIHMQIHCLGHFSLLPPTPYLFPLPHFVFRQNLFCLYL